MSDYNSSLPVRTENAGDVVVKVGDGTTPSQQLAVDSSGRIIVKLDDGSGNVITSQASSGQRALDVGINVSGTQIDPRQIRALTSADVVSAVQSGTWTVQPGNTANTTPWLVSDGSDGSVTAGAVASKSSLGGLQFNTSAPTLTTGQQVALQGDSSGNLFVNLKTALPAGANIIGAVTQSGGPWTVSGTVTATNASVNTTGSAPPASATYMGGSVTTAAPTYTTGQMSALSLSTTGSLRVDGSGSTQPVSGTVTAKVTDATGTAFSTLNPLPVTVTATLPGTSINDYNTSAALAAAATSNHDYAITSTKTFLGKKFWATASGKLKAEIQVSPDGTIFTTKWVGFNSTANPNISIDLDLLSISDTGAGAKIRIIRTNVDKQAMDVYSTISGTEQ